MRCLAMSVQFAVLASGSRGNSTLVRGRGAGLLIDVGIGPKSHRRAARERRRDLVANRGGRLDAHARRPRRYRGVRGNGTAAVSRSTAMRAIGRPWPKTPGFRKLEEARLDLAVTIDAPFLTSTGLRLEPIELRHDGGPTFGFRIEVIVRTPATACLHRLPGRHGLLVRNHGREPGRCRRARRGIQSRRGSAEVVAARPRVPDRAQPERSWAPVEPARGPSWSRPCSRDRDGVRCAMWSCCI